MARKRNLSDAFSQFEEETNDTKQNKENEHENKNDHPLKQSENKDVTNKLNNEHVTKDVTLNESSLSVSQVKQDLLSMYEEKTKKETMEDTHVRTTFLFRKDLSKRLDKLAKNKRGFKTMFLNKAIEALLDELEKK
ncbi:hypothetical protein DRW41_22035 [Neobacillus piezotolerans]|uniref:Uncharacterized protein n=1 Tax=Neobacillus piezotolerans TaxID=2259171 RepID=A0A3D8GK87_9BACI|nr:hypothetical protein [Neobacillus piezotolerans]RDU34707.1 hypothetical protein DRW41_22035 [Neobacillus piezotolerans]